MAPMTKKAETRSDAASSTGGEKTVSETVSGAVML